ncbi:MAG: hypothetical protein LBB89_03615 [Treponema sp.]|jgi:K+ transporter|nr:hypothetical protein [Treponema sp.]
MEYLINLGISILGSAITMFVTYFWKLRHLYEKTKFRDQKAAEKNILDDISKSKKMRVYAMCGSTFSDEQYSNIAKKVMGDLKLKQLYLISDENNKYLEERQKELPKNAGNLKTKVKNSKNNFDEAQKNNSNIEYRLHNKKVGFRLIILDNCLYVSQQEKDKFGKNTEIQRIAGDTPAYINYSEYFDGLWEDNKSKGDAEIPSSRISS